MNSIDQLNDLIATCPGIPAQEKPRFPVLFIVGLPRSGSTVLAQVLIHRLLLGYVTNLVAKFWMAPEYGIALARAINEDPGALPPVLSSAHGQTGDYEGHHEFGYFWKRWFTYRENHYIEPKYWDEIDGPDLLKSLVRMEMAWDRPLIFKNPPALSLQIALLNQIVPNALFLNLTRSDSDVATSLYHARKVYHGSHAKWFSVKPPQYSELTRAPVVDQIAGQVLYTRREIERQLSGIPPARQLSVSYENLCSDTAVTLSSIENWLEGFSGYIRRTNSSIPSLSLRRPSDEDPFVAEVTRQLQEMQS